MVKRSEAQGTTLTEKTCPNCNGIGTTGGATYTYCSMCNKTGKVSIKRAPTPVADSGATLNEAAIQSMVQTRGRLDGSLWKFDALGISLLINDIARALLAAAKPVIDGV